MEILKLSVFVAAFVVSQVNADDLVEGFIEDMLSNFESTKEELRGYLDELRGTYSDVTENVQDSFEDLISEAEDTVEDIGTCLSPTDEYQLKQNVTAYLDSCINPTSSSIYRQSLDDDILQLIERIDNATRSLKANVEACKSLQLMDAYMCVINALKPDFFEYVSNQLSSIKNRIDNLPNSTDKEIKNCIKSSLAYANSTLYQMLGDHCGEAYSS